MNPEKLQTLQSKQNQILNSVSEIGVIPVVESIKTGILKKLLEANAQDVEFALGDFGSRLKAFASFINFESPHPELLTIFDGVLVKNDEISKEICDLYDLLVYAKSVNCSDSLVKKIQGLSNEFLQYSTRRVVGNSLKNLQNARFVDDPVVRNNIRQQKKFQMIGLTNELKNIVWEDQPSDFDGYHRYNNRYTREINAAQDRVNHFNSVGLSMMAQEIEKDVVELSKLVKDVQYFGFNKITLTSASIILAKLLEYEYESFVEPCIINKHGTKKLYTPVAYTLQECMGYINPEVSKFIEYLESFPEMANKPIFDHYRVLVPSFDYSIATRMTSANLDSSFSLDSSLVFKLKNEEENPDLSMIKDKQTIGILLGERDGQLYFLSYWM